MSKAAFLSALAPWFERFVQLKQTSGASYRSQTLILRCFDRHLATANTEPSEVDAALLGAYLACRGHLAPRTRANMVSVIWPALAYANRHDAGCSLPSLRPTFPRVQSRTPVILFEAEIERLLLAARALPPVGSLRPHTYATLFGLLSSTGLRIGEARRLRLGDVDFDGGWLLVLEGKFRKSRRLPLRDSTVAALARYVEERRQAGMPRGPEAPFFVSLRGRPLVYANVQQTFSKLIETAGLVNGAGNAPRLHDLRHGFALRRVIAWYRAGIDVNTRLRALSTYLGHVSVEKTLVYLKPHEAMLGEAARRFEDASAPRLLLSPEDPA